MMERDPKSIAGESSGGPDGILVVEDERLMRRILEKFFSQHGYTVLTASDGAQAIEVYRRHRHRIAAVLLDIRLPKTTGEAVYLRLKEENPAVKVIIASGYLAAEVKTDLARAGVKHFVNKPYVLNELLAVFQEVIGE